MKNIIFSGIILLSLLISLYVFKDSKPTFKNNVIADVNHFFISVQDLDQKMDQLRLLKNDVNSDVEREQAIELLIEETILLQQAVKLKINEDPSFLKNIEHFWKQNLIQELLKLKSAEYENNLEDIPEIQTSYLDLCHKKISCQFVQAEGKVDPAHIPTQLGECIRELVKLRVEVQGDKNWSWRSYIDLPAEIKFKLIENPTQQVFVLTDNKLKIKNTTIFLWQEIKEDEEIENMQMILDMFKKDLITLKISDWINQLYEDSEINFHEIL